MLSVCSAKVNSYYSGFVVDEAGAPISGVVVCKYYGAANSDINEEYCDTTDERGYFYVGRKKESLPDLVFSKHGYVTDTVPVVWMMHGEKVVYSLVVTSDTAKVVMYRQN